MESYIGTKVVNATPMNRLEYNALRGWVVPTDENPNDAGYLVEYTDGGKANVPGYSGYVSWSPKEQFDNAYRETTGMSFGLAIEALKQGKRVARAGWNGKGMWITHMSEGVCHDPDSGIEFPVSEFLVVHNADGRIVPWFASQADMLAEDWRLVP